MLPLGIFCKAQAVKDELSFKKFPQQQNLTFITKLSLPNSFIRTISFFNHHLILTDLGDNSDVFLLYNINGNKIEKKFIKKGTKKNEAIAPLSSGIINETTLWLHDISLNKIVQYNINNLTADTLPYTYNKLNTPYYSMQLLGNNTAMGYSAFNKQTAKLSKVDLANGATTHLFGAFENKPQNFSEGSWKHLHEGFLFSHPQHQKLVFACKLLDKFYIINLQNDSSFAVVGPHGIKPNVTPVNTNGNEIAMTSEKTKLAYVNGYCTDKYIYLIYTDGYDMQPNSDRGKNIYVFNWQGKPIKSFTLDRAVSALAVINNNTALYAFDADKQELLFANISL